MRLFNEQIITRPYTYNIDFACAKPHTGCVIVEVNKQLQMLINTQVYLRTSEYYFNLLLRNNNKWSRTRFTKALLSLVATLRV